MSNDGVLASLDTYKRKSALNLKRESRRLARLQTESAGYAEDARKVSEQIEAHKKFALAEYVSPRKIVLERLEQLLQAGKGGKAQMESAIHNLIFPQRTDTESFPGIDHHLWIVDERLESHNYLASDQSIDAKIGDRPDLLIALDIPGAFASDHSPKARG